MKSYQTIKVEIQENFAQVILNRPEKRNALNKVMVEELKTAFSGLENNKKVRVVTLRGAGKAFCSGADLGYLKELRNFDYQKNFEDSLSLGKLFLQIYSFSKPVIAVVTGPALAGGCGLASVCDLIIARPGAKFGYPEVKIGFVAALVSAFLKRQIGERKARELLLTGEIITAEQALQYGLINKVATDENLEREVHEWMRILVNNGPQAMATTKRLFLDLTYQEIETEIKALSEINAKFRSTEEFFEGISAFLEKRTPNWQS
ncbi:enoyl-CoA hydratase/isomerase family protein [Calditrichota bacterium GD2]